MSNKRQKDDKLGNLRRGVPMRLKRLFCYHKWIMIGNPYLWEGGITKRVDVKCVKCGKISNVDIFNTPKRRWA